VRSMTVGDREALLLQLRRLINGDVARCTVTCPSPACGEPLDLDLTISSLLVPEYSTVQEFYDVAMRGDDELEYAVRFRLPTGRDQERAALIAERDLALAADLLLESCVESVVGPDRTAIAGVPAALRVEIGDTMSRLDTQAELTLDVTCTCCGDRFRALFDAASYLHHELRQELRTLERDRHLLAFHYHWSLAEIHAMPTLDRRRTVAVLERELSRSAER
jgi:hypothetical protein